MIETNQTHGTALSQIEEIDWRNCNWQKVQKALVVSRFLGLKMQNFVNKRENKKLTFWLLSDKVIINQ